MINELSMTLKMGMMPFSELESFKKMARNEYETLIEESQTPEDKSGFEEELSQLNQVIRKVQSKRIFDFLGT